MPSDLMHESGPLLQRWDDACRALGGRDAAAIDAAWLALEALYHHPPRYYHTLEHIRDCLSTSDRFEAEIPAGSGALVRMAILTHDCVYDSRRDDNEARSASVAGVLARAVQIPRSVSQTVQRLILATTHRGQPADPIEAFVRDVDLSSLGAIPRVFDANTRAIRAEFAWAEEAQWRAGRSAFFREMLARDAIFHTPGLRTEYEAAARDNLHRAIRELDGPETPEATE